MRGSPEYQASILIRKLFREGSKKTERIDPTHQHYQKLSSYITADTYKKTFISLIYFAKNNWKINDCTKIDSDVIEDYLHEKIDRGISQQYLERLSSAIGKFEIALKQFMREEIGEDRYYDFSIRFAIVNQARRTGIVVDNYHNRAYKNPQQLIDSLSNPVHKIAALVEYEGGARISATTLIKPDQLLGYSVDPIIGLERGLIMTREKGGIRKEVMVSIQTYDQIKRHVDASGSFKIDRQRYMKDIRETCIKLGMKPEGSHGLRWSYARRRMMEYAKTGYTYEQSLQAVSWEMKHQRLKITTHYLG